MDCGFIPQGSYQDFANRLLLRSSHRQFALSGSLELTARCNLNCLHCYIRRPLDDRNELNRELTLDEVRDLIDQLVEQGCLWLLITGGEPLIRADFEEIYLHAKRRGLLIMLFTNGTMISPERADFLSKWPPYAMEISLYGCTQSTYESITHVPGSFARCLEGITLLRERKIVFSLKTMVLTLNLHEIPDMITLAKELGVKFRFDPMVNLGLNGEAGPARFRVPAEKVVALDEIEGRDQEWLDLYERFHRLPSNPGLLFQCGAGIHTFHIDSHGMLSPCMMVRHPSYDLRQGAFSEGWSSALGRMIEKPRARGGRCEGCKIEILCGQCPGWALIEHGDPERRVEYLCEVAHLRARALGILNGLDSEENHENREEGKEAL